MRWSFWVAFLNRLSARALPIEVFDAISIVGEAQPTLSRSLWFRGALQDLAVRSVEPTVVFDRYKRALVRVRLVEREHGMFALRRLRDRRQRRMFLGLLEHLRAAAITSFARLSSTMACTFFATSSGVGGGSSHPMSQPVDNHTSAIAVRRVHRTSSPCMRRVLASDEHRAKSRPGCRAMRRSGSSMDARARGLDGCRVGGSRSRRWSCERGGRRETPYPRRRRPRRCRRRGSLRWG